MLSGPAETGKTLACLWLLNELALDNPGLQAAIVRKTYKSMPGTVLETFEKKVLPVAPSDALSPVAAFGGMRPERYIYYANGSTIWVGGMDNPDRILSAERDVIYVNQAEELSLEEWETLLTRATGRAGHIDVPFVMGDCNPAWGSHWILKRSEAGQLVRVNSRHEDNPVLYDQETGELTEQGRRTLGVLDSLTGVRYQRLRLGKWITEMEGALWKRDTLDSNRVDKAPALSQIVVAIDPAVTSKEDSDETGIVVCGLGEDGHGYVLQDLSGRYTPEQWARRAVEAYNMHEANWIVAEVNNGGDLVERNIRLYRDGDLRLGERVSFRAVRAARGKYTRAEPIGNLYEQGRIHHVGVLPDLEDQQCTWVPGEASPDRVDALVWGMTELMLGQKLVLGVL
jgi:predicted phage terminase large subunit-like protein